MEQYIDCVFLSDIFPPCSKEPKSLSPRSSTTEDGERSDSGSSGDNIQVVVRWSTILDMIMFRRILGKPRSDYGLIFY